MFKKIINKIGQMPEAAKAGLVFLICSFMQKGISTLTTPIFTRLLSTEEYGAYNVYVSWSSIFTIFITLKIAAGVLQQSYVKYSEDKKIIGSSMQGLSTTLCLVALVVYVICIDFWNELTGMTTDIMLMMIVGIWATNVFEIWAQKQRTDYKWKKIAVLSIVVTILKPTSGILSILLFPNMKVQARIYSLVLVEVIAYVGLFISQLKGGPFYSKKYWGYALRFNLPLVPHYLSQQVLSQTDRLMINSLCGASVAGIYSLAYQIGMVMTLFISAMSSTLNPWIYRCIKEKKYNRIEPNIMFLLRALELMNIIVVMFVPEILGFFAPVSYYEAVWAIPPVTMSCIFMFMYGVFVCFEFYFEKRRYIVYASVTGAVLNVVLNIIFIPKLGYLVAAYTTLVCYIVFCVMHYVFMIRTCRENGIVEQLFSGFKLIKEFMCFLVLGISMMFFYDLLWIRIIILIGILIIAWKQREKLVQTLKDMRGKRQ